MPQPIQENIVFADLQARFIGTSTVTGSPAAAAETIVATLTDPGFGDTFRVAGVRLTGMCAFTVGTTGTAATLRIRQTNVAGTIVSSTGALTVVAANLVAPMIHCFDALPGTAVYVMTLQVTGGSAISTVSAVHLSAVLV
jgi:hypothetical protein